MRNTLAALALAPLLLAGCGGESGATDDPTPKLPSTSTSEPTSTEPTEPIMPSEAEGTDAKSAEAFVRYYFDVVNYAQATGNTELLRTLSQPSCTACEGGAQAVDDLRDAGATVTGGEYSVRSTMGQSLKGLMRVDARVFASEQTVAGSESAKDGVYPAGTRRWTFFLTDSEGEWSVTSFRIN